MISRRIIRIKVLQVLYAYYTSPDKSINLTEKELFFSIQKTYDLYHYILQLPVEIANHAHTLIELRRKKHFPTEEDLNPNLRFVNNQVICQLRSNKSLNNYLNQSKMSWRDEPELVRRLYNTLLETDFYAEYMSATEQPGYADDRKLLELLFGEVILQSDDLNLLLEEKSIYWNDDLDFVTSMIIKTLKKFKEFSDSSQALLPFFKDDEDREFAKNLFRKSILNHQEIKKIVEQHTVNWDVERIAFIDNMILELAIVEFLTSRPSPPRSPSTNILNCRSITAHRKAETSSTESWISP